MLEKLTEINWKDLTHAYGSASDVPEQIKALCSSDKEIRENTIRSLYGNIFHQGTRYQATPFAVPFLYELLASEEVYDRESLLFLLVNIALGYENYYLSSGLNMVTYREKMARDLTNMTAEDREYNEEYGFGPQVELDCYDSVKKGLPIIRSLAKHKEDGIRRAATYALAWFPEEAETTLPLLKQNLNAYPAPADLGNTLLVIGYLAKSTSYAFDLSFLKEYLTDKSPYVKVSAAIALAKSPLSTEILNILIETLIICKEIEEEEPIYFNESNLTGYIGFVLSSNSDEAEKIVPALCKVLATVNAYQSLDVTNALLEIICKNRETSFTEASLDSLSTLEKEALTAILHHGGWKIGNSHFTNFSSLVRSYGLHSSQEDLKGFLNC